MQCRLRPYERFVTLSFVTVWGTELEIGPKNYVFRFKKTFKTSISPILVVKVFLFVVKFVTMHILFVV